MSVFLRSYYQISIALIAVLVLCRTDPNVVCVAAETPGPEASGRPVEVQMRNVMYHFTDIVTSG
jgi:hypothetical protein